MIAASRPGRSAPRLPARATCSTTPARSHQQVVQRVIDAIQLGPQRGECARSVVPPAIRLGRIIAAGLAGGGHVGDGG